MLAIVKIDEKVDVLRCQNDGDKMIVNGIDGIDVRKANNVAIIVEYGGGRVANGIMKTKKEGRYTLLAGTFQSQDTDENFYKTNQR